jgi:hypothetical protein
MMCRDSLRTSIVSVLTDYIVSNNWMIMNNELEGVWKEAVIAQFEALSLYLPEATEERREKTSVRSVGDPVKI